MINKNGRIKIIECKHVRYVRMKIFLYNTAFKKYTADVLHYSKYYNGYEFLNSIFSYSAVISRKVNINQHLTKNISQRYAVKLLAKKSFSFKLHLEQWLKFSFIFFLFQISFVWVRKLLSDSILGINNKCITHRHKTYMQTQAHV